MNRSQFLKLIRHPSSVNQQLLQQVDRLLNRYPYFQGAHVLIARTKYLMRSPGARKDINLASLYTTDRQLFKDFMSKKSTGVKANPPGNYSPTSKASSRTSKRLSLRTAPLKRPDYVTPTLSSKAREELVNSVMQELESLKRNMDNFTHAERDRAFREQEIDKRQREEKQAQALLEAEKKRIEEERTQLVDQKRVEEEKKRKEQAHQVQLEAERKRIEEQKRVEEEKKRKEEAQAQLEGEKRRLEEERKQLVEQKRVGEEQKRKEEAQAQFEGEKRRLEEERKQLVEQKRVGEEQKQKEQAYQAQIDVEKQRLEMERKRIEEQKHAEMQRLKEQAYQAQIDIERKRLEVERERFTEQKQTGTNQDIHQRLEEKIKSLEAQLEAEKQRLEDERKRLADQKQIEEKQRLEERIKLLEAHQRSLEEKLGALPPKQDYPSHRFSSELGAQPFSTLPPRGYDLSSQMPYVGGGYTSPSMYSAPPNPSYVAPMQAYPFPVYFHPQSSSASHMPSAGPPSPASVASPQQLSVVSPQPPSHYAGHPSMTHGLPSTAVQPPSPSHLPDQKATIEHFIRSVADEKPSVSSPSDFSLSHSESIHDEIRSEELAELYRNQGHIDRAIEIYHRLCQHYPEKSNYFLQKIREIRQ